jgi:hypothetical protein
MCLHGKVGDSLHQETHTFSAIMTSEKNILNSSLRMMPKNSSRKTKNSKIEVTQKGALSKEYCRVHPLA